MAVLHRPNEIQDHGEDLGGQPPEVGKDLAEVVAAAAEDGEGGVAIGALEVAAGEAAVGFRVIDLWLGCTAPAESGRQVGFGPRLIETLRWLQGELGQGNFARHKAETFEGEALGFHCRRTLDALDFLTSIPGVRLVDSTEARNHRRPVRMKAA